MDQHQRRRIGDCSATGSGSQPDAIVHLHELLVGLHRVILPRHSLPM